MKTIIATIPPGTLLWDACRKVCRKAKINKCNVAFSFNGTTLKATPKTNPDALSAKYLKIRKDLFRA